jgi:hypothetical protein
MCVHCPPVRCHFSDTYVLQNFVRKQLGRFALRNEIFCSPDGFSISLESSLRLLRTLAIIGVDELELRIHADLQIPDDLPVFASTTRLGLTGYRIALVTTVRSSSSCAFTHALTSTLPGRALCVLQTSQGISGTLPPHSRSLFVLQLNHLRASSSDAFRLAGLPPSPSHSSHVPPTSPLYPHPPIRLDALP